MQLQTILEEILTNIYIEKATLWVHFTIMSAKKQDTKVSQTCSDIEIEKKILIQLIDFTALTSVTFMTLIAANCPVLVWRP